MPAGHSPAPSEHTIDLNFSPPQQALGDKVRAWFCRALPEEWKLTSPTWHQRSEPEQIEVLRQWQARLQTGGWLGLAWPREYGGRGADLSEQAVFAIEAAVADAPEPLGWVGIDLIGPSIIRHGTDAQRQRFLWPMLAGEEIWCQAFSEPDAGSDMASMTTRATLKGDRFVVDGQKTWCSWAHVADWGMVLVRTDPSEPRHRGISALLVDTRSPGITIRRIPQITGHAGFSEIFFDAVEVPAEHLLGPINDGWRVAMTTLDHARGVLGLKNQAMYHRVLRQIVGLIPAAAPPGSAEQVLLWSRFADAWIETEIVRLNAYRALSRRLAGEEVGVAVSLEKLHFSIVEQMVTRLHLELLGPSLGAVPSTVDGGYPRGGPHYEYLYGLAASIYGGTTQIHRNIVAERILGMPRDR